ncbi:hypothetical protein JXD20_01500 [Candidatus Peregrinibacteria bacterium]|nr:hypothetical protein [Candidatus Peregrinibacteria bacterium]
MLRFVLTLLAVWLLALPALAQDSDLDADLEGGLEFEADTEAGVEADAEASAKAEAEAEESSTSWGDYPDSDDGPVLILEATALGLPGPDNLSIFRMALGNTFRSGIQLGGHLTYSHLSRPSVDGVTFFEGCPQPSNHPFPEDRDSYMLDPDFSYWGVGPWLGYDLELINGWFGLEFTISPTFPITDDSSGWSIEFGAYPYISLEWLTADYVDLAVMLGMKFGHFDIEADRTHVEHNRMMVGGGIMLQF